MYLSICSAIHKQSNEGFLNPDVARNAFNQSAIFDPLYEFSFDAIAHIEWAISDELNRTGCASPCTALIAKGVEKAKNDWMVKGWGDEEIYAQAPTIISLYIDAYRSFLRAKDKSLCSRFLSLAKPAGVLDGLENILLNKAMLALPAKPTNELTDDDIIAAWRGVTVHG